MLDILNINYGLTYTSGPNVNTHPASQFHMLQTRCFTASYQEPEQTQNS